MKRLVVLLLVPLLVLLARPAFAGERLTILVPSPKNLQHMSFWVAKAGGYFAREGLDVELIDLSESHDEIIEKLKQTRHSVLPVQDGQVDTIIGVIARKDLAQSVLSGEPLDMRALVKQAPVVMDRSGALDVLKAIRASLVHMALVFDEYGHFEGIITPGDILEAITGAFQEEEGDEPAFVTRADGSYLVSGWMQADEFEDKIGVKMPKDAKFETVAGFVLAELNHLPAVGETFERGHWRFEVLDLDGRRIDKVLVTRLM